MLNLFSVQQRNSSFFALLLVFFVSYLVVLLLAMELNYLQIAKQCDSTKIITVISYFKQRLFFWGIILSTYHGFVYLIDTHQSYNAKRQLL